MMKVVLEVDFNEGDINSKGKLIFLKLQNKDPTNNRYKKATITGSKRQAH